MNSFASTYLNIVIQTDDFCANTSNILRWLLIASNLIKHLDIVNLHENHDLHVENLEVLKYILCMSILFRFTYDVVSGEAGLSNSDHCCVYFNSRFIFVKLLHQQHLHTVYYYRVTCRYTRYYFVHLKLSKSIFCFTLKEYIYP